MGQRLANDPCALVGEKALVDLGPVRHSAIEFDVILAGDDPLVRRQAAQALVPCGRRQPGPHPIRVLDTVNVLEQSQPGRLGDVGGIAFYQLVIHGNGPDQPRVLINQAFPRLVIPVGGAPHQRRHIEDAEILVEHRRQFLSPI